jgi:hypothetical protein
MKSSPPDKRLGLRIRGSLYLIVERQPQDPEIARLVLLYRGDGAACYQVHRHRKYGLHCDCGDFEFRRNWLDAKGCKHVKALLRWGFL